VCSVGTVAQCWRSELCTQGVVGTRLPLSLRSSTRVYTAAIPPLLLLYLYLCGVASCAAHRSRPHPLHTHDVLSAATPGTNQWQRLTGRADAAAASIESIGTKSWPAPSFSRTPHADRHTCVAVPMIGCAAAQCRLRASRRWPDHHGASSGCCMQLPAGSGAQTGVGKQRPIGGRGAFLIRVSGRPHLQPPPLDAAPFYVTHTRRRAATRCGCGSYVGDGACHLVRRVSACSVGCGRQPDSHRGTVCLDQQNGRRTAVATCRGSPPATCPPARAPGPGPTTTAARRAAAPPACNVYGVTATALFGWRVVRGGAWHWRPRTHQHGVCGWVTSPGVCGATHVVPSRLPRRIHIPARAHRA